jgi:hypothetical protein
MHHYPCYYTKQHRVTYSYRDCPGKAAINIINQKEIKRKFLPPRKVSLHPTHSLANEEIGA